MNETKAIYVDGFNREWNIALTVGVLRELRKVDLDITDAKAYERMASDVVSLADTLWILCKSDAVKRAVSEDAFYDGICGEAIESGANAIIQALINFSPLSKKRLLESIRKKSIALQAEMIEYAEKQIDSMSLKSVTNTPESSASIPNE